MNMTNDEQTAGRGVLADGGLAGRVALVTGASSGIGRALARRLGTSGAVVGAVHGGHGDAAADLVSEIVKAGGRAERFGADLSDPDACLELVGQVRDRLGPVDLLVPGAGVGERKELAGIDLDVWHQTFDVNVRAPFVIAQAVIPEMRQRRFGRILFLSSVAAFTGGGIGPHYAASKAALLGLTHSLAPGLAAEGITVNAIAPALIAETQMLPGDPDELAQRIPIGRLGKPEEVADLAVAMLTNPYLTNQVISLDGGIYPR